jgi:hypothetical protein
VTPSEREGGGWYADCLFLSSQTREMRSALEPPPAPAAAAAAGPPSWVAPPEPVRPHAAVGIKLGHQADFSM